jgi:hypothetical protein
VRWLGGRAGQHLGQRAGVLKTACSSSSRSSSSSSSSSSSTRQPASTERQHPSTLHLPATLNSSAGPENQACCPTTTSGPCMYWRQGTPCGMHAGRRWRRLLQLVAALLLHEGRCSASGPVCSPCAWLTMAAPLPSVATCSSSEASSRWAKMPVAQAAARTCTQQAVQGTTTH